MADPPLVTSDLVGLLLILHFGTSTGTSTGTGTGHRKYQLGYLGSTEDSTQQYWTSLNLSIQSRIFVGQPLITTGLVNSTVNL